MNITVGITLYNRINYLRKLQQSLAPSHHLESCNIRIYDDCSSEFGLDDIKQLFPYAAEIIRRTKNLGADQNMRQMFVDFLTTNDDILVILDSDLICRPDWIPFTRKYFSYTDGILSLYNSAFHKPTNKLTIQQQDFLEKEHIGAAGAILHKDIIQEIVKNVPATDGFDWLWCNFLRQKGKRILVSKSSYFQHIGLKGYNCNGLFNVEYGLNFYPLNELNRKFLADFFQEAILLQKNQND